MINQKPVVIIAADFTLRVLAVLAIANVLLITVLVSVVDKQSQLPGIAATLGLPLTLILGVLLMIMCSFPGWIAKCCGLQGNVAWYLFRIPALLVTILAIKLFLLP